MAHDPPSWFDARGKVALPEAATKGRTNLAGQIRGGGTELPVLLHDTRAFVVSPTGVQVVDLTSGRTVGEETARGEALRSGSEGYTLPPVLAGSEVLVPFLLATPASGTHTAGAVVELVAVSTAAPYKAAWRNTIKLPEWALQSKRITVAAVAAQDGTAVVTVVGGDTAVSYGIDTASHALRWTHPGLKVVAVGTGMATGLLDGEPLTPFPVGVDLATGSEKWRGEKTYAAVMEGAGPATVRIAGQRPDGSRGDQLVDVSNGQTRADMPPGLGSMNCTYDQTQTLVCAHVFAVAAVDPASGQLLWAIKNGEGDREAPGVTAVWHGRVYGKGVGGPVALDARTGADMPTRPEAAPLLVNAYAGLVLDDNRLWSYLVGG
uniref:Pyrrolo-quinoline quinone n=1 Tax=Streptomyces sp. NBC_00049 TaxID=2903617 RepID=A0AAU2K116_9ACTN